MDNKETNLASLTGTAENDALPKPETTEHSSDDLWNYYNLVNATEPQHKKRTGTNQTPAKKHERKKHKARRTQRASRKTNRK